MNAILRIHHAGEWAAHQVSTTWAPSAYIAPPGVQSLIDNAWNTAISVPGRNLFDGPMCRLESWDVSAERVAISLSRTSYKTFWGTNISHPELGEAHGVIALANPVGVSPALESADGWLLLGQRNTRVAYYPSRVHPFSGCLEPGDATLLSPDPGSASPSLFHAVMRELNEELGLLPNEVPEVRLTGIAEDLTLRQPELIFRAKSRLNLAEIQARLDLAEHDSIVSIRGTPSKVSQAVRNPILTPVAASTLLLWGRLAFGQRWYADIARHTALAY